MTCLMDLSLTFWLDMFIYKWNWSLRGTSRQYDYVILSSILCLVHISCHQFQELLVVNDIYALSNMYLTILWFQSHLCMWFIFDRYLLLSNSNKVFLILVTYIHTTYLIINMTHLEGENWDIHPDYCLRMK